MNQYYYKGPVMEFERCIIREWESTTYAVSEKKAKNNLTFQAKHFFNKPVTSKISLPGKVKIIN